MVGRTVLTPGAVFAGYTIERLLGVGGMGAVYLATHPRLPLRVALKLLHGELTGNDYVRSRFESEAENVARLNHPNIVGVQDRGQDDDQLWIVMQYVEGTSAEQVVRQGPVRAERAVFVVTETAKALDYAHSKGVLHRDVKPDNILLEHDSPGRAGRVLLADFGIAKALSETRFTQTGMLVASLQYAAPEQFEGKVLDARADVYSLGCTLFHLLTGQLPFPGTSLPQLMHGHLAMPVPRASLVRPGVAPGFDAVIGQALAKNRDDRYPSCGALAAAAAAALSPPAHVSRGPDREFLAQTIPARIPPPDPRVRHFANPETDTVVERPERSAQRPPAGRADRIFGNVARVGLVLLMALICAALVTWRLDGSYYSSYYRQYYDYVAYQPLRFHNNTQAYSSARTFLIAIAFAGVVLILLALISARRAPAGRLALIGAGLLSFGLFALELAIHSGASVTAKKGEMQYIALLGGALLLVGCWRGLAPSKGNQLRFLLLGIAVLALAAAPHLAQYQDLWVLSQGGGGIISGLALIAAALMLNGRRHGLERAEFARR